MILFNIEKKDPLSSIPETTSSTELSSKCKLAKKLNFFLQVGPSSVANPLGYWPRLQADAEKADELSPVH